MSVRKRFEPHFRANGTVGGKEQIHDARTDLTRWRLKNDRGCQTWHYLETEGELERWPMTAADRHYLDLDTVSWT